MCHSKLAYTLHVFGQSQNGAPNESNPTGSIPIGSIPISSMCHTPDYLDFRKLEHTKFMDTHTHSRMHANTHSHTHAHSYARTPPPPPPPTARKQLHLIRQLKHVLRLENMTMTMTPPRDDDGDDDDKRERTATTMMMMMSPDAWKTCMPHQDIPEEFSRRWGPSVGLEFTGQIRVTVFE